MTGLTVELTTDSKAVRVAPGLAYDSRGRELLLAEPMAVKLAYAPEPGQNTGLLQPIFPLDLVARYSETLSKGSLEPSQVSCPADASEPSRERPILTWRRPEHVQLGLEVPLTRAKVPVKPIVLDSSVRRYARRLARPHLATGRTPPGTLWDPWPSCRGQIGWSMRVNTSEAGFTQMPIYFASLSSDWSASVLKSVPALLGPFTFTAEHRLDGFLFVVVFAVSRVNNGIAAQIQKMMQAQTPAVVWTGIESDISRTQPGIMLGKVQFYPVH